MSVKELPVAVRVIIAGVSELALPFVMRSIAGDPAREIQTKNGRLTQADLDSPEVRRARMRYWHCEGYARQLIAHQLYPALVDHPGDFDTPERLAAIEQNYREFYGHTRIGAFA